MTDGGSHFNNGEVWAWCEAQGTTHHVTAAYVPWINGLVKNVNGKLLGQLKRLCSPGLGEDNYEHVKPENITRAWPDHFDTAICQLNECIIPSLQFSPKKLLLGFVINTTCTPLAVSITEPAQYDVTIQMTYVDQQQLDGTDRTALHTVKWKAAFDLKILKTNTREIMFERNQLVQVY
ncbi:hypothetical protein HD554DRAFT_2000026, partial [Boletus coccyginus]